MQVHRLGHHCRPSCRRRRRHPLSWWKEAEDDVT